MTLSPLFLHRQTKSSGHRLLWVLAGAGGVYFLLSLDAAARSRECLRRADECAVWALDPAARDRALDVRLRMGLNRLENPAGSENARSESRAAAVDLLRARRAGESARSPAGQAYRWYRDAYRQFSPPESDGSRKARLLAAAFKRLWKKEMTERGLPVRNTFWDEEPGLDPREGVVFSAARRKDAESAQDTLIRAGVLARVQSDPRPAGAGDGHWVVVPAELFQQAHEVLAVFLRVPAIVVKSS